MSAHDSLKVLSGAAFERSTRRTLPAQCEKEAAQYLHIAQNLSNFDIELINAWLHKIGEPEADHFIVLDKCINDPEAMKYFLKHARGEFNE